MRFLRELWHFFRLIVNPRARESDEGGEIENSGEFEVAREQWRGV